MKAILKNLLLLTVVATTVISCGKDVERTVLKPGGDNQLTITSATLVLLQANAANVATVFGWGKADFGYDAAITYTIQLCKGGTNFASSATTTEVAMGTAVSKSFTVKEFNDKMQEIIGDGVATPIQVRVKASVGTNVNPIYSNVLTMTVTSYLDIVTYTFPDAMNVAGNFQGWDPPTAPQLVKTRNGGFGGYEGYIVFNNGSPEFKIVKGNNWGAGDYGNAGGGNLQNGGPNLTLPSGGAGVTGLYRIRANTTDMTWSFDKINTWGIIGSSTANSWNSSTPMTFDPATGNWSITTNLSVGEMKFRANDAWSIDFGDNAPADGKPEYGGANIAVTQAGNYTITLNIGRGGNYSYKLRRN